MKKVVTMQDISCIGKCSLTVALPVLSALGVEAIPLPTALLSTHTMFQKPFIMDLTSTIHPIMEHWKKEHFSFDGIYTGYLGAVEQLQIARELFETFETPVRIVDPCMADHGKLYAGFNQNFVDEMKKFCATADIIIPNITECCYLLDLPYTENYNETTIRELLIQLCKSGTKTAILTGVEIHDGKIGAYAYQSETDTFTFYETDKQPHTFHGTGDIWASCFCGEIVNGKPFSTAIKTACDFVAKSIACTLKEPNHNEYGVNFEQVLNLLTTQH